MKRQNWLDRFDSLNRSRTDGMFTLEVYHIDEIQESIECENEGFFFHVMPFPDSETPERITLFYFKRDGETFKMNLFIFTQKLFYMEYKTGYLFNDLIEISGYLRHRERVTPEQAQKTINSAFDFAYQNINKIFKP